ncbi:gliding motility-associated lipoprotein GldB [Arenibacter palladensis]|uniref:Gliding motility-associated lipoprotein GldB n=1 Tax=Arenibacter palladensis TaxID=237373 RepID=A0A1M5GHY3_9FLAO|nr:gliding motility lipoprotein GldB [Arenibacter palladensis]SHG03122.1 gliding motility-associated lipoprotein GldB [Arenibacter palladensis]
MQKAIFLVLIPIIIFCSCNRNDKLADEVAKINVDVKVNRFDMEFAEAKPTDIPSLKEKYPYLFPANYPDSIWAAKLQDTLQLEVMDEVGKSFPDFVSEKEDIEWLFRYIKYYFPNYEIPRVVTVTSEVDYNNRIILADSLLLVGLDNYLGSSHKFYQGISRYIANDLDKQYLTRDMASAFAKTVVAPPRDRTFLSQLVYYGKELYLMQQLMPQKNDAVIIGYAPDDLEWANVNEEQIWRYFIERELLYSTNSKLGPRFLDPAPFSKFELELDNESPGKIGRYIGWQIVKSFMDNNNVTLQEMLTLPEEELFKRSGYKPRKL